MNSRHPLLIIVTAQACLTIVGLLVTGNAAVQADGLTKAAPASAPLASKTAFPRLRYRIVVDQGKWNEIRSEQWFLPPEVGAGIQAQLVDKLQKSGYFIVMEREATAQGQASAEDAIDATKRNSLPAGTVAPPVRQQRTAGNYIITPSVAGFVPTGGGGNGVHVGPFSFGSKKSESTVTLNIRISNAQTSEIIDTQTAMGKAEAKSNGMGLNLLGGNFTNEQFQSSPAGQAVDRALDDAVAKIVARLSKEPWTALVAAQDKNTNRVIINAGDQAGVSVGQTFDVFRPGDTVLDPDTSQPISTGDDVKVGRIKVARVTQGVSYCDVLDGTTFLVRDIVKATN